MLLDRRRPRAPEGFDVDTHFNPATTAAPAHRILPDGDLFAAAAAGGRAW